MNAVEELLRYDSPVQATDRIATESFTVGPNPAANNTVGANPAANNTVGPNPTTGKTVGPNPAAGKTVGCTVAAGDTMLLLLGAANRDPWRFESPDRLRLDRADVRPISFGHGIHHCVGAALARLEARIAITAFVDAHPRYLVDERRLRWKRSTTLRGPSILPVVLDPG